MPIGGSVTQLKIQKSVPILTLLRGPGHARLRLRPALRSRGLPEGAADLEQRADSDHAEPEGCQS